MVAFRAASSANGGSGTSATITPTLPTGWQAGDMVLVLVNVGATTTWGAAPSGWTLTGASTTCAGTQPNTAAVYTRVMQAGDTAPAFTAGTSGKWAWVALALSPGTAGNLLQVNAQATVKNKTTASATDTPNSVAAAGGATVCSCVFWAAREQVNQAVAIGVTPATSWTEPTNGETSTAVGTTSATRQVGAEAQYRTGQTGTVAPGATTFTGTSMSVTDVGYHILVEEVAPVTSPALELSSFGTFTGVGSGDTINKVTVDVTHKEDAGSLAPTVQLWDGTTAQIGSTQTCTTSTTAHTDSFQFTGVTYSQLATLRVRVTGQAPSGKVLSVDSVGLTVNYSPSTGATGTLSASVPRATSSISGTVSAPSGSGTLSASVPRATASISGTVTAPTWTGTLSAAVPVVAVAGGTLYPSSTTYPGATTYPGGSPGISGTVSGPPPGSGTLSASVPVVTASISGSVAGPVFTGTLSAQVPRVTASMSGTAAGPVFTGSLSASVPLVTASVSGAAAGPVFTGTLAASTPHPLTSSAAGTVTAPSWSGTLSASVPVVTSSTSGTVTAPSWSGTLSASVPVVTASISGTSTVPSGTATLNAAVPLLTASITGTVTAPTWTGSLSAHVPVVTASMSGTAAGPVFTGTLSAQVPLLTASITGADVPPTVTGTFSASVPLVRSSSSGVVLSGAARDITITAGPIFVGWTPGPAVASWAAGLVAPNPISAGALTPNPETTGPIAQGNWSAGAVAESDWSGGPDSVNWSAAPVFV